MKIFVKRVQILEGSILILKSQLEKATFQAIEFHWISYDIEFQLIWHFDLNQLNYSEYRDHVLVTQTWD